MLGQTIDGATGQLLDYGAIGAIVVIVLFGFGFLLRWVLQRNERNEAAWQATADKGWDTISSIQKDHRDNEQQHREERERWREDANSRENRMLDVVDRNTVAVDHNTTVVKELHDTVNRLASQVKP